MFKSPFADSPNSGSLHWSLACCDKTYGPWLSCFTCMLSLILIAGCGAKPATAPPTDFAQSSGESQSSLEPVAEEADSSAEDTSAVSGQDVISLLPNEHATAPESAGSAVTESDSTAATKPNFPLSLQQSVLPQKSQLPQRSNASAEIPSLPQKEASRVNAVVGGAAEVGLKKVDIFFATDRKPMAQLLPGFGRTFAPTLIVAMLALATMIGFTAAKRFTLGWLLASGLATCLSLIVLHDSILRWQQYQRLASGNSTRFSGLPYETRDYPLHVGEAVVTLPSNHQRGNFEKPSLLKLEFAESPDRHIMLQSLIVEDSVDAWFEQVNSKLQTSGDREGFIFVHGYNVLFGDAIKRTAQLAYDLGIQGPAICYSWPSRGKVLAYTADEATVQWSAPHLEQLLVDLRDRGGCKRVNILAHSMGTRAVLDAIERLELREKTPTEDKLIDALVLAAPDVDARTFTSRYTKPILKTTHRATVYLSDGDLALKLSNSVHQAPRLGVTKDWIEAFHGIEAVYVGDQPFLSIGHSYYGSDRAVVDDVRQFITLEQEALDRPYLREAVTEAGANYWMLDRVLHARATAGEPTY